MRNWQLVGLPSVLLWSQTNPKSAQQSYRRKIFDSTTQLELVITDFIITIILWKEVGPSVMPQNQGSHEQISLSFVFVFKHNMMIRFPPKKLMLQFSGPFFIHMVGYSFVVLSITPKKYCILIAYVESYIMIPNDLQSI